MLQQGGPGLCKGLPLLCNDSVQVLLQLNLEFALLHDQSCCYCSLAMSATEVAQASLAEMKHVAGCHVHVSKVTVKALRLLQ